MFRKWRQLVEQGETITEDTQQLIKQYERVLQVMNHMINRAGYGEKTQKVYNFFYKWYQNSQPMKIVPDVNDPDTPVWNGMGKKMPYQQMIRTLSMVPYNEYQHYTEGAISDFIEGMDDFGLDYQFEQTKVLAIPSFNTFKLAIEIVGTVTVSEYEYDFKLAHHADESFMAWVTFDDETKRIPIFDFKSPNNIFQALVGDDA